MMFDGVCMEYGEPVAWLCAVGVTVKTRSLLVARLMA